MSELDVDGDGIVTKNNFISWWFSSSANLVEFDSAVRSLLFLYGMNFVGQKSDELHAFAQYLNRIFKEETKINNNNNNNNNNIDRYLPIDPADGGHDILSKLVDGVLLAKMINFSVPETIDERVLHYRDIKSDTIQPKQIVENLNIVLSSCKAIGVSFSNEYQNISVEKFLDPSHYEDIIREILSELSKIHLSKKINLRNNPVLIRLAAVYEDDDMIKSLTSEQWLKRWINYQLKRSGEDIKIRNFGKDFRDGSVLCHILHSVTKRKKKKIERFDVDKAFQQPTYARPGYILKVLQQQFGIKIFLAANDILSGNSRLICLLCAQIFGKWKGMRKITKQEIQQVNDIYAEDDDDDDYKSQPQQVIIKKYSSKKNVKFANDDMKNNNNNKYKKGQWDIHNGRSKRNINNGSRKRNGSNNSNNSNNNNKQEEKQDNNKQESEKQEDKEKDDDDDEEDIVQREIREEKDIINWMNEIFSASLLYDKRYGDDNKEILKISNVTRDLKDGLVLLYFMDLLAPNIVNWENVNKNFQDLTRLQCLTNCHYIISLIKKEPFSSSFFEIESYPSDGNDIYNCNKDLIFKICHNLINYHYICTLTQLLGYKATEFDILHWTNEQLKKKLKYPRFCSFEERKLHQFNDNSLKSCLYYIDLLLMLMDDPKNDINRDIVIHKNNRKYINNDYTKSECLSNARYALSIARKFGAIFYISPYDLVNVTSSEITMSFVMCIMVLILTKQSKDKQELNKNGKKFKSSSTSKYNKNKNNNGNNKKDEKIIDALQIHLEQNNNNNNNNNNDNDDTMNDNDLENIQNEEHERKRSVLQDYGIITDTEQLQELQSISRQYSSPNIVTPNAKKQSD